MTEAVQQLIEAARAVCFHPPNAYSQRRMDQLRQAIELAENEAAEAQDRLTKS